MRKIIISILSIALCMSMIPAIAMADEIDMPSDGDIVTSTDLTADDAGFHTDESGATYFYTEDGEMHTGFLEYEDSTYYFSTKTGKMLKGMYRIKGDVYTFNQEGKLIRTVYKNQKAVALTFDDGPSKYTKEILDVLEENNQLASFFVIGSKASKFPKTLKRAYDMGCMIGNHSWDHSWYTKLSESGIKKQVSKCDKTVKNITGKKPIYIRTPGGHRTDRILSALDRPVILWSIDTRDWEHRNADKTYNHVIGKVKDGDIVLMHDMYRQTADAAIRIIPELVDEGYQLVTVKELSLLKGKTLKRQSVYYYMR